MWLFDAGLQAQPALFTAPWWRNDLAQSVMGQPAVINHSIFSVVNLITAHPAAWNTAFVGTQVILGVALILGRHERVATLASIPWALGIWWVGEGFGTLPTGFALAASGAPGPVLLYPLIAVLAWPHTRPPKTGLAENNGPSTTISWRGGAAAWVFLWAGQALLQIPWAFPARQVLVANVSEYSNGQPGWLQGLSHGTETLARHHPGTLTATMVVTQIVVGLGVLHPKTRAAALSTGVAVSVAYWLAFQYLGGIPAGDATDPGTAPLLILLAVALWPLPFAKYVTRQARASSQSQRPFRISPKPAPSGH
jgi:hypothetical protein